MKNILPIFNVFNFSTKFIDDYLLTQNELERSIVINLKDDGSEQKIESLKNQIKKNIAMVDDSMYNELVKYKYHIHHQSLVYMEIKMFNGTKIWGEIKTFDEHITFLKNYNDLQKTIEYHGQENNTLLFIIKVSQIDIKHQNFNKMLQNKNISIEYIEDILKELSKTIKIKYDQKLSVDNMDDFLNFIIKNNPSQMVKTNIEHFKETLNLFFLLQLCNHDFWANSNF